MVMLPDYATLEEQITAELRGLLPTLELEPVKGQDIAALQDDGATTFSFATTGAGNRLQRAGILAIHFYAESPATVLGKAYSVELDIEDTLNGSESKRFVISGVGFDTRVPILDEDTREFIHVECTYNILYTVRRP